MSTCANLIAVNGRRDYKDGRRQFPCFCDILWPLFNKFYLRIYYSAILFLRVHFLIPFFFLLLSISFLQRRKGSILAMNFIECIRLLQGLLRQKIMFYCNFCFPSYRKTLLSDPFLPILFAKFIFSNLITLHFSFWLKIFFMQLLSFFKNFHIISFILLHPFDKIWYFERIKFLLILLEYC